MNIAFASGKGGTGKTTVTLAAALAWGKNVTILDCDVEEPNCHLFLSADHRESERKVSIMVPRVDESKCTGCGECRKICQFSAIVSFAGAKAMTFSDLCHSCGGCTLVCTAKAITEIPFVIGSLAIDMKGSIRMVTGRLDIGHPMAPPVIREVLKEASADHITLIDAPPGTSCSFMTTVKGSNYTVLVTEPTPFGLHDLTLAVAAIRQTTVPFGVIINRMDSPENEVTRFCERENIPVLLQIPYSRRIAEFYSLGKTLLDAEPLMKEKLQKVFDRIFFETRVHP